MILLKCLNSLNQSIFVLMSTEHVKEIIKTLPNNPGVYQYYDKLDRSY